MRFKIENQLEKIDYKRLVGFLEKNPTVSVELFSGVDLKFLSVSPVAVTVEGLGYKIDAEILLEQPIGFEIYDDLKFDSEIHGFIAVNRRNVELSKIVAEPIDFGKNLNIVLKTVERIVNHMSIRFDKLVEQVFTLNSEWLDRQLDTMLRRKELEKRGEVPGPFGAIHAKSSRDAKERAGGLIPLYKERDKMYLYDDKQVYFLLPHNFVANLLRCDDTTMIREEEFDRQAREVLRDLVYKKRLRKHMTLDGTVCYYGLDGKTRRYLVKHLERKTSRL